MSKIDDGGPAFPGIQGNDEYSNPYLPGMSLRDYFAGQALIGLYAGSNDDTGNWAGFAKAAPLAETAFEIADAMLAARKAVQP